MGGRVVREAQQTDTARGHAALLFEQALLSLCAEVGARCVCVVAPRPATARSPPSGARLFGQALCRLARSSEGASFVYWRGIVKQEIEAEARQRRSAAAMERGRAALRAHVSDRLVCLVAPRRSNLLAAEEQRLLATKLLARGLKNWARKSASAAFHFWQRQNATNETNRGLVGPRDKTHVAEFQAPRGESCPTLLSPMAQQRGPEAAGAGRSSRASAPRSCATLF